MDLPFYGRFFVFKNRQIFCWRLFGLFLPSLFGNETLTSLPKRVKRYIHMKYSYPNAVRRTVRTSSCSLIILNQRKSPSATRVSKEIETDFFRRRFFSKSREKFPKGRGGDNVSQRKEEARRVDV